MAAQNETRDQMERRSGSVYELFKKNSNLINAAWRAAGSRRKPASPGTRFESRTLVRHAYA
jgi:hypothetical protein